MLFDAADGASNENMTFGVMESSFLEFLASILKGLNIFLVPVNICRFDFSHSKKFFSF